MRGQGFGTQVTIEWSDGSVVTQMVEESAQGHIDEPVGVRYLSQQFVERLSRDIDTQRHHRAELNVRKARATELAKGENNLNESIQSLTKGSNPQIAVRLQAVEKALGLPIGH